jgi:CBS domain-containing protein
MKKCSEVMTKDPVCCLPDDLATKAARLMKTENIGAVPVIESQQSKRLVGIVTDRDLALHIVAEGHSPDTTRIDAVMTRDVVTCHANDDAQKALDAMSTNQLRRIPVVDDDHRIVGIISQADVATRLAKPEKTGEVVKEISQSNGK